MFCTVLHHLKSPENVGILIRTHVALGGAQVVVVGPEPWRPKDRAQAFSRRLERLCEFVHCIDDDAFFSWCRSNNVVPIAIEIATPPTWLPGYSFPERTALVIGHESRGIAPDVLARCAGVVTIPQHGPVACLNVAVSGAMAMYELVRGRAASREIGGDEYVVEAHEKRTADTASRLVR